MGQQDRTKVDSKTPKLPSPTGPVVACQDYPGFQKVLYFPQLGRNELCFVTLSRCVRTWLWLNDSDGALRLTTSSGSTAFLGEGLELSVSARCCGVVMRTHHQNRTIMKLDDVEVEVGRDKVFWVVCSPSMVALLGGWASCCHASHFNPWPSQELRGRVYAYLKATKMGM